MIRINGDLCRPYLVKAGKGVVLALFCHTSPVVEDSPISASWIGERHPLPGTYLFTTQLGFDCPVTLSSITGQQRGCISVDE